MALELYEKESVECLKSYRVFKKHDSEKQCQWMSSLVARSKFNGLLPVRTTEKICLPVFLRII